MNNMNNPGNNGYNNQQPPQGIPTYQVAVVDDKSGLGVAALVFGIISLVTCASSLIPPVLSVIFALLARNPLDNNKMHGTAKIGLILTLVSLIPFVLGIVFVILFVVVGAGGCAAATMGSI